MNKFRKTFKLLIISSFSIFLYYYIENNPDTMKSLQVIYGKHSMYGHGDFVILIFINVIKYFFFLLGLAAIIFLILRIFKIKNKCI
jgi:hypothetical protein